LLALSFGFDVYTYQLMIPASKLQELICSHDLGLLEAHPAASFGSSLAL
jgi:hypothetical protein